MTWDAAISSCIPSCILDSPAYASRVDAMMMNERTFLRKTIAELTKKLTFVAKKLQKVSSEQDQIIAAAAEHEATMHQSTKTQQGKPDMAGQYGVEPWNKH